jgi:hypothetical protein
MGAVGGNAHWRNAAGAAHQAALFGSIFLVGLASAMPRHAEAVPANVVGIPPGVADEGAAEPWGAEDQSAEDDRPRIPEPMVFDLIRPLGARRGEFEINTLVIAPVSAVPDNRDTVPDALGLSGEGVEWAPELEYAVHDDIALEFELPFREGTLGAYKGAAQWTFGTDPDMQFIHGTQLIVQYDRQARSWLPTLLYLAGRRVDETWSVLAMLGARGNSAAELGGDRVEFLANLSLFGDFAQHLTAGLETNFAQTFTGRSALLLMPQVHWEITDVVMLQGGIGARLTSDGTVPEAALRLVRSF